MKHVLMIAAVAEMATGLALIVAPSMVGQLLLGVPLAEPAATVAGVLGLALLGLGAACWPGPPRLGMLFYSALVTLYLAYAGFSPLPTGPLLWPAVVLHGVLAILLLLTWKRSGSGRA
ncbi:hypothetical protein [Mesorhizobium sp. L-8-10]|uniref:hypothetical protein n=1 Tax=Mesorhizobium sp. L-8-10 TaxID=2744523 RepID=UPI0019253943|nr:hypothetical protein [Mesorhizobium sp. L-8-10]